MSRPAKLDFGTQIFVASARPDPHVPALCAAAEARGNDPLIVEGATEQKREENTPGNALRLNALFAISVNSPSTGMVNFPCCVDWAPISRVHGVERRVTPRPAAFGMRAGDHA